MVQSVKNQFQLFFAIASLTALILVTLGSSPPIVRPKKIIREPARVCSLANLTEKNSNSNLACETVTNKKN